MKTSQSTSGRTFISERSKKPYIASSNIFGLDNRYVNEDDFQAYNALSLPIKLNLNLNNNKITNCREGVDENDVCTMRNIRNLSISITHFNTDLSMNNNRITNLADGIALNDAVNVRQLINSHNRAITQIELNSPHSQIFYHKSGRLTFNRYGVSVIYKSPIDSVAVGILLISKGSLYVQQPIVKIGEYTLFIPPLTDISVYTGKDYYFYYWKCNFITEGNSPGLEVTQDEFNNLHKE